MAIYEPSKSLLKKYADVLVKFALNGGNGVKEGEVVQCIVPDVAKPLLIELHESILEAKAHPMIRMIPTGIGKAFFDLANDSQLTFFPKKYIKSRVETIDHSIGILAEHDLHELSEVDPKKIMKNQEAQKVARDWMMEKENAGKFSWTLALYGTPAMADEAGMNLEEYWGEIIRACFLDKDDPIATWKQISVEQQRIKDTLNKMKIAKVHMVAEGTDLWITIGERRQWLGGGGRNIPSFEIFTSPDWRGTEGEISFNQPLYRYGSIIKDVKLTFRKGKVVEATASKNQDLLKQMIARSNADKVGEFSMTDSRMSQIHKFMANTLFDENIGGRFGNSHIAVGMAYKDTLTSNPSELKKSEWSKLGFNDSGEHCGIVTTTDRTITAFLHDGTEIIIFRDGKFQV